MILEDQPSLLASRPITSLPPVSVGQPIVPLDVHSQDGYAWWLERIKATLNLVDIVRIDHFRGFAGIGKCQVRQKQLKKAAGCLGLEGILCSHPPGIGRVACHC